MQCPEIFHNFGHFLMRGWGSHKFILHAFVWFPLDVTAFILLVLSQFRQYIQHQQLWLRQCGQQFGQTSGQQSFNTCSASNQGGGSENLPHRCAFFFLGKDARLRFFFVFSLPRRFVIFHPSISRLLQDFCLSMRKKKFLPNFLLRPKPGFRLRVPGGGSTASSPNMAGGNRSGPHSRGGGPLEGFASGEKIGTQNW